MKKTFCSIMLCYVMLCYLDNKLQAQTPASGPISNPLQIVNQQMRDLFTPLTRPTPIQDYLYDMSAHVTDDKFWTNVSYDTSNTENWYRLYWEQFYMAYDTSSLISDEAIYESVLQYRGDTIPIGILDVSYYKFNSKALTTSSYFIFDTVNDMIFDITNRATDPYFAENIFTCAPLYNKSTFGKITWVVSPGYFFKDITNSGYYIPGSYDFEVDFGDGLGFRTYDPTQVNYETIDYNASGIQNQVFIKARIRQDGIVIKHSKSSFILGKTGSEPRAYDEIVSYENLPVYVYRSCNSTPENRKIVIYLEGLDVLDFSPKLNRTAQEIYHDMLQVPNISQLANFGYDFYIVDWANSRIDMRANAMSIVRLIDALKAEMQNNNEFIIIGESMGGVIARYALTYMESANYIDPNIWPNANRRERMHNCRLMITWDSPHQGANIPLSIQHFYNQIFGLGGNIFGMPMGFRTIAKQFNMFLDATAAKQLLIYHVDTKSGWGLYKDYSQHSERTSFLNDLASLGNYPQFCKKMAVSNGALNGQMQSKFASFTNRVANDKILYLEAEQSVKILSFINVPFFGVNIDLKTNPNGQGQVYQMNAGSWGIRLKFYWFGVKLLTGYNTLYNKSEFADVKPYCVNAGGYMGDVLGGVVGQSTNSGTEWNLSRYWLFNLVSYKSGSDGNGCWNTKAHVGLDGFASANYNLSMCSDGMQFGFVPLQSALDFGTLGSLPLNHNFENDINNNRTIINTNTPFDVIVANGTDDATNDLNLGINNLNKNHLYVKYENRDCFLSSEFTYRDCASSSNCSGIFGHWVNREIGDETLYLDNLDCNRNSTYEAEYELFVNTFTNPWYAYTNGSGAGKSGFYSKSNEFLIRDNITSDFKYDFTTHNPPAIINYLFYPSAMQGASPYSGLWTQNNSAPMACVGCFDFGKKQDDTKKTTYIPIKGTSNVMVYPNPSSGKIYISYTFNDNQPVTINITDMLGRPQYTTIYTNIDNTQKVGTAINLINNQLSKGIYFVSVSNGIEHFITKLIIE